MNKQVSILRLIHLNYLFQKNSKNVSRIFAKRHIKNLGSCLVYPMVLLKGQVAASRTNISDKHFSIADIINSFPELIAQHQVEALPKLPTGKGKLKTTGGERCRSHCAPPALCCNSWVTEGSSLLKEAMENKAWDRIKRVVKPGLKIQSWQPWSSW